jgi:hypothetical protein
MMRLPIMLICLLLVACGSDEKRGVTSEHPGGLLLDQRHGDDGLAWGLVQCDACHALSVIHAETTPVIREMVRDKGYPTCTGCHGSNGTNATRECRICHNETDLPGAPYLDGHLAHAFVDNTAGSLTDQACLICHTYSDMNGQWDLNQDLSPLPDRYGQLSAYLSEADFCLRCHNRDHQQPGFEMAELAYDDPRIALEDDYHHTDYHGWRDGSGERTYHGLRDGYRYPQLVACSDCHALHGTGNEKLIIDRSDKGARQLLGETFRLNTYTVEVDEEGNYAQLCVLCHQMSALVDEGALDSGNGLSGVHSVGEDCRPCHTHGEASQAGL